MRCATLIAAVLAILVITGCGGPDARQQAATQSLIAAHAAKARTFPAPAVYQPMPWKAGQWILMKHTYPKRNEVSVHRLTIIRDDAGGCVIESATQDYRYHTIAQQHYSRRPNTPDEAIDLLQKMVTKSGDDAPVVQDFTQPPLSGMKGMMRAMIADAMLSITPPSEVHTAPRETITVPAGTFQGAARITQTVKLAGTTQVVTAWFHPAVPINGGVQTRTADGEAETEILDFGTEGGKSGL